MASRRISLGFSLDNLSLVATDPLYRDALLRSLRVAGVSTLICLLMGFPMALAISRAAPRWQNALLLAVMLPFWTGFLMRINAWIGMLADDGLIARVLGDPAALHRCGDVYRHCLYIPAVHGAAGLRAAVPAGPGADGGGGRSGGAAAGGCCCAIILPLSLPGVAAGVALVFVPAIGEYVIPALLGGPQAQLIGKVLWDEFFANRDWPTASAVAVWLLVVLVVVPGSVVRAIRWFRPARAD